MAKRSDVRDDSAGSSKAVIQGQLFLGAAFANTSQRSPNDAQNEQNPMAPEMAAGVLQGIKVADPLLEADVAADLEGVSPHELVRVPAPREIKVFTVGELVRSARVMLETRYADVRVLGEVSSLKPSGPGHIYFTLKEAQAQIDCVMFSREAARLKLRPADGMQVRCRGRLTIYEGRGKFQMTVVEIEPTGAGALSLAFEQLKTRLAAEGLFLQNRKRALPFLPRCVGVVTSPTGAVIRDIVHVAHRRFPMRILLSPTAVQGDGAALQIVNALERLWAVPAVDVIILARGGGSLEDLWAFNEEIVARAIVRSPVPVISAVGHETDFTIADFVADCRAPTPSAAAEIAIPELRALHEQLQSATRRLQRGADRELQRARLALERLTTRISDPRRMLDRKRQGLDDLQTRAQVAFAQSLARKRADLTTIHNGLLRAHPQKRIAQRRASFMALERRLANGLARTFVARKQALARYQTKLETLSPLRVLDRGYSLMRTADGHLITRANEVQSGQRVEVTLRQGSVTASVQEVHSPTQEKGEGCEP